MGNKGTSMNINESFLKETSMNINEKKVTNNLDTKERDYMIRTAMKRLGVSAQWHDAVARGACYLQGDRFWELVDHAMKARKPANYFVFCIGKELEKAGL
jgi:hypothetical protein